MKVAVLRGVGVIAPYVLDGFATGFSAAGHQVVMVDVTNGYNPKEHKLILDFKPDVVFLYGFTGLILAEQRIGNKLWLDVLFRQLGIPAICVHYDNPFLNLLPEIASEMIENPDYYYNFIWDDYFLNLFQREGMPNCFPIMLATDPTLFSPVHIKPESALAFVGGINLNSLDLSQYEPIIQRFIEIVIQTKVERFAYPLMDICFQVFKDDAFLKIKQLFNENPYAFWADIYRPIHTIGSSWYRYSILNSIEEIPVHVYGANNWQKDNIIIHDRVAYGRELSKEYQKYAVNLNLSSFQLETSVNNRVFDVFAAKGFVLSDYKRDMEKIFPKHWREVTFKNLDELGAKGDYYLTHEEERKELTEELHQQILKHHTYRHRVEEIVSRLNLK